MTINGSNLHFLPQCDSLSPREYRWQGRVACARDLLKKFVKGCGEHSGVGRRLGHSDACICESSGEEGLSRMSLRSQGSGMRKSPCCRAPLAEDIRDRSPIGEAQWRTRPHQALGDWDQPTGNMASVSTVGAPGWLISHLHFL